MTIREHTSLGPLTTFRTGGEARYFCDVQTEGELTDAIRFTKEKNTPFHILGGGSNTLFTRDFPGLVIKISIPGITFDEVGDSVFARVGAGENWDSFVETVVQKNLWGIENLSFIPGSVGGVPIQNIGAYGSEAKETIHSVEVFDTETCTTRVLSNAECLFAYRSSLFKTERGRSLVVTAVTFELRKSGVPNISYKDLADYFEKEKKEPSLRSVREAVIAIRRFKLPDINEVGTAGSFFKNPVLTREKYEELQGRFPSLQGTALDSGLMKISAGWFLDHIGQFKGFCRGEACVWERQALVLVNKGNAEGKEILLLAEMMREKIKKETGIVLENEVVIV